MWAVGEHIYQNPNSPPNFLDSSLIIHFDGNQWREIPIEKGRYMTCVWGNNPSDVWLGGTWGTLYHFDGNQCRKILFDSTLSFSSIIGTSTSSIFVTLARNVDFGQPIDSSMYLFFHYDGSLWTCIDSFNINLSERTWKFGLSLWQNSTGKIYSSTYGIYTLNESFKWNQIMDTEWPVRTFGNADNNIFAVGGYGIMYHWNGDNWVELHESKLQGNLLYDGWTNNKETFITSHNGRQTYIYHGK